VGRGDAGANLDDLDRLFDTVKREKGQGIDVLFCERRQGRSRQNWAQNYRAALSIAAFGLICARERLFAVSERRCPLVQRWRNRSS